MSPTRNLQTSFTVLYSIAYGSDLGVIRCQYKPLGFMVPVPGEVSVNLRERIDRSREGYMDLCWIYDAPSSLRFLRGKPQLSLVEAAPPGGMYPSDKSQTRTCFTIIRKYLARRYNVRTSSTEHLFSM